MTSFVCFIYIISWLGIRQFFQHHFLENRKATDGKEQSADIIGTNLSKAHLVSYISYAYNGIQQYRMVKGKVATPKCLLFVVTQIKKDQHSLTEQSVN